jgi:hypothetical protein
VSLTHSEAVGVSDASIRLNHTDIQGVVMSRRKGSLKMTWRQTWPIWLTFGLLFGFGVFGVLVLVPGRQATRVLAQGEDVKLATSDLRKDAPRMFAMPPVSRDKSEFFVERGIDDNITVAFASCRKCYRSGHYRQGSQVFCGRCNEPMERLARGQTPPSAIDCTQIPIPFERSGESVVIRASAVRDAFTQWYVPSLSKTKPEEGQK